MHTVTKERGWAGHFICAYRCMFRRNTLLIYGDVEMVVSTVGMMRKLNDESFEQIGCDRYYETMAFYADKSDERYHDADVSREVDFDSEWMINEVDADDKANDMHEVVVLELSRKLELGHFN